MLPLLTFGNIVKFGALGLGTACWGLRCGDDAAPTAFSDS